MKEFENPQTIGEELAHNVAFVLLELILLGAMIGCELQTLDDLIGDFDDLNK